jgi:thymidylate synthase (FAD)
MRIVQQAVTLEYATERPQEAIERAGRTCYRSEEMAGEGTAGTFCRMLIARGHCSVLEHASATFRIVCDRGVSHELVRHRLASYSQESTRFCNYSTERLGNGDLAFVEPPGLNGATRSLWWSICSDAESAYNQMIQHGATPEIARSVLPNALKTEIVMTANLREWREIFRQRCAKAAHPQMREVAMMVLAELRRIAPDVFADLAY